MSEAFIVAQKTDEVLLRELEEKYTPAAAPSGCSVCGHPLTPVRSKNGVVVEWAHHTADSLAHYLASKWYERPSDLNVIELVQRYRKKMSG